jgi:hypothetical protein
MEVDAKRRNNKNMRIRNVGRKIPRKGRSRMDKAMSH